MPTSILKCTNLQKDFDGFQAVKGVSFEIEKGEVFGFLGPNGAGKSTTINILATLLEPSAGTAKICGFDIKTQTKQVREVVGLCTASTKFFWDFTPKEILNYYAQLYGIDSGMRKRRIASLVEMFEITDFQDKWFSQLSTGMKQKVALAKSLINKPKVWFLDEPTNGLDLEVSKQVRKTVQDIVREEDMTVLLTSHYLTEVEELCKRMALINKGELVVIGGIREVKESLNFFDSIYFKLAKGTRESELDFVNRLQGIEHFKVENNHVTIRARSPQHVIGKIIDGLEKRRVKFHDLEIKRATLEDTFLKLIKTGENESNE